MSHHRGRNAGTPDDPRDTPDLSPDDILERYHLDAINTQWDALATLAWHGYQRLGRGFVLLSGLLPEPEEGAQMWLASEFFTVPPELYTYDRALGPAVANYDPDTEFIVVTEQTDGFRATYRVAPLPGQPTPREAAQASNLPL
jgi:hypothetical protein